MEIAVPKKPAPQKQSNVKLTWYTQCITVTVTAIYNNPTSFKKMLLPIKLVAILQICVSLGW